MLTRQRATEFVEVHMYNVHLFHAEDERYVFHGLRDEQEVFAVVYMNHVTNRVSVRLDLDGSGEYATVAQ